MKLNGLRLFLLCLNSLFINAADLGLNVVQKSDSHNILAPIEIFGSKFFNRDTGEQFFMKGIAYQPSFNNNQLYTKSSNELFKKQNENELVKYIDPMGDSAICLRDLPYLIKLGVNTVRVYSVNSQLDHNTCMDAFAKYGIYVLFDLSEPDLSIDRESPTWDVTLFQRYKAVVDSVGKYSNTLGFFAGNEVTTDKSNSLASSYVKASVRDIKAYLKSLLQTFNRQIPVGYSTNDDPDVRENLASYFVCDSNVENRVDFYGINMYEWCGYSSFVGSGYKDRTIEFRNFPVPVFFSEFGCNEVRPRPFTEVEALFSKSMSHVWSGGLVYMYFEEENQYGVVKIDKEGEVHELEDFHYLEKEFSKVRPKKLYIDEYKELFKPDKVGKKCPSKSSMWESETNKIPPTPDFTKCSCLDERLPCVLVTSGNTKQDYSKLFEYICGEIDCSDIESDINNEYGNYGDCSASQKISYIISKLYFASGSDFQRECPALSDVHGKQYTILFNENYAEVSTADCENIKRVLEKTVSKKKLGTGGENNKSSDKDKDSKNSANSLVTSVSTMVLSLVFHLLF